MEGLDERSITGETWQKWMPCLVAEHEESDSVYCWVLREES